jgi:hypothetical protein
MPQFQEEYPHFALLPEVMAHGRNNPFAPFFSDIWYSRFQSAVLETVMANPDADIAAAVHRGAQDMQRAVNDYWEVHDHATYRRQGAEEEP